MYKLLKSLMIIGLALILSAPGSEAASELDPENTLVMELEHGKVVIQMLPEVAPNHVARIKELTRQGFYDGLAFHRVIDGFMAQTGDPSGTGRGGSGQTLKAEFSPEPYLRGTVGMARAGHPDSADSQFFITFAPARFLDNKYTVWGRVVEGMENVDRIKKAPPGRQSGAVDEPDRILRLRVMSDITE